MPDRVVVDDQFGEIIGRACIAIADAQHSAHIPVTARHRRTGAPQIFARIDLIDKNAPRSKFPIPASGLRWDRGENNGAYRQ